MTEHKLRTLVNLDELVEKKELKSGLVLTKSGKEYIRIWWLADYEKPMAVKSK